VPLVSVDSRCRYFPGTVVSARAQSLKLVHALAIRKLQRRIALSATLDVEGSTLVDIWVRLDAHRRQHHPDSPIETNHADGVMGNLFMLGPFGAQ